MTARHNVSVIIPTHDRAGLVQVTLRALKQQTFPAQGLDVVVAADGCSDGTAGILRSRDFGLRLTVVELPGAGPAAARNCGARAASGDLLVFMDDDILPEPGFIEAHVRAHERPATSRVVVGYSKPSLQGQRGMFRGTLRGWWESMFATMAEPGHRFTFRDLLSGNFSVSRRLFRDAGEFDPAFRVHEDWELGLRLIAAGARLEYCAAALGHHQEATELDRALRRKFDEGRADVQLLRKHPQLAPTLPLFRLATQRPGVIRSIVDMPLMSSRAADMLAAQHRRSLVLLEAGHLYRRWRRGVDQQLGYWYRRGVLDAAGSTAALRRLVVQQAARRPAPLKLDLRYGLCTAERALDAAEPASVLVSLGDQEVGLLPAVPGAEPWRGVHLRPALESYLSWPLMVALTVDELRKRSETARALAGVTAGPRRLTVGRGRSRRPPCC